MQDQGSLQKWIAHLRARFVEGRIKLYILDPWDERNIYLHEWLKCMVN